MKNRTSQIIAILMICSYFLSCNAPRNNPLDPNNPDSPFVRIEGTVQTLSLPHQNIANVKISLKESSLQVITDASGSFSIDRIYPQDGWLVFEKAGFHTDSTFVTWGDLDKITVEHYLNALPVLDSCFVFSTVNNRFPALQDFEISIEAMVSDPDGDIDSVFWNLPDFNLDGYLKYNVEEEIYEWGFNPANLGLGNEEYVGHDFIITVQDKFKRRTEVGQKQIKRVIKEEVLLKSPVNGKTVISKPALEWYPFNPGFSHIFKIEIIRSVVGEPPELVWEKKGIPETRTAWTVDQTLQPGEYFWAVWATDQFKNNTRSKFNSFVVQ